MNKDKIIADVLREYSLLSENAGIGTNIDPDVLFTAIENLGYQSYFSNNTVIESLAINEAPQPEYLSDEDIQLLQQFTGPKSGLSTDDLKKYDLSKVKDKIPPHFPPPEHTKIMLPVSTVDDMVEKEVAAGGKVKITLAPTKVRIYLSKTGGGLSISKFHIGTGVKIGAKDFFYFLRLVDFYKKHRNDIEVVTKEAAGLVAQDIQVNEINEYFKQNNPNKIPFHLFIKDGPHTVDCGVAIDSSDVISGSGKADITMKNKTAEVFWVSFKKADYLHAKDKTKLASPGFKTYGGSIEIGDKLGQNKLWTGLMLKLTKGMIRGIGAENVLDVSSKNIKFQSVENSNAEVIKSIDGKNIMSLLQGDKQDHLRYMIAFSSAVQKFIANTTLKKKYIYFTPKDFSVALDFVDGTRETREIAGKAIYGIDFEIDTSGKQLVKFGRENVNILMHSKTPLTVTQFVKNDEPAILLSADARGHVLFNPNLPLPKDMEDPIMTYRPVFNAKYVLNEFHLETINGVGMLFLGTRIFILPAGKVESEAEFLK